MSNDTSRSLLDRLQSGGKPQDWDIFCKIYQPLIRSHLLVRKIATDDVDDVVQEILSRVFRAFGSFAHNGRRGAFRKWLGQIVSQQTWQYFQSRQKQLVVSEMSSAGFEDSISAPDEMESQWETEHDRYLLGRLLELIKPDFTETTWRAFHLLAVSNVAPDLAAHELGVSLNAVMIAKSRVLRRLRIIGKDLIDTF